MSSCLGIYIGDKVVKYAKLVKDENSSTIKAVACGTKIHPGNKSDAIKSIVTATGSETTPVCINSEGERVHKVEVLKRLGKADLESLIDLEVIDFTGNEDKSERSAAYKYALLDSIVSKDNYTANIIIQDKSQIEKYIADEESPVSSLYSLPFVMDEIVSKNESNYLIINMSNSTDLIFVNNGKLVNVTSMDLGMKKIFDNFPEILGSYQKSYDICKTINLLSDESSTGNPELENIIEPVLQDALNRIQIKIKEVNVKIDKIFLAGSIGLFINSDLLFEQYFDIPTEKLRPYFVDVNDPNVNASEVNEAIEAFALAYEGLIPQRPEIDFLRQPKKFGIHLGKTKSNSGVKEISDSSKKKSKSKPTKALNQNDNVMIGNISLNSLKPILLFANILMLAILLTYSIFSVVYGNQMVAQIEAVNEENSRVADSILTVNSDISYIDANKAKYANYTSYVTETLRKITNGEIGKYSTYNVAMFMLKVSKYIPEGVTLKSISSDSSRHVTIVATSNSHAKLGYLISQLRLEGILKSSTVQTTAVVHDDMITVTIGGDLP